MREWLIVCSPELVTLERIRFGNVNNTEVIGYNYRTKKKVLEHLNDNKPVLCMGILPEELNKVEWKGNVYWFLEQCPYLVKDKLEQIYENVTVLFSEKDYYDQAKRLSKCTVECIESDLTCYDAGSDKKRYSAVFIGNYLNPKDADNALRRLTSECLFPLVKKAISFSKKDYSKPIQQVWREVLLAENLQYSQETIDELIILYHHTIAGYIERISNERMILGLLKRRIPIAVVGENWEVFAEKFNEEENLKFLTIIPKPARREQTINILKKAKIYLGVNRMIQNGLDPESRFAMNLGCIAVTEKNPMTVKLEDEGWSIVTYSADRVGDCARLVEKILKNEERYGNKNNKAKSGIVEWLLKQP